MNPKKIKSIKRIKQEATVYNFHVPKYESYVANGFITHNCYVARHNNFGNPLITYSNVNEIIDAIIDHWHTLPPKYPNHSNQQDRWQWVYDIGECTDMLSSRMVELTNIIVRQLLIRSELKPTFATKLSSLYNISLLDELCRERRARIRVSLMPQRLADVVEIGTVSIAERIKSLRYLYNKGYEVHINFSPVIIYDGWVQDYIDLFSLIDKEFSDKKYINIKIKGQLKCEVIFLTHHNKLHESNLKWNPSAEKVLWAPEIQEYKTNNRGANNILRYNIEMKKKATVFFNALLKKHLPYCQVRYIF